MCWSMFAKFTCRPAHQLFFKNCYNLLIQLICDNQQIFGACGDNGPISSKLFSKNFMKRQMRAFQEQMAHFGEMKEPSKSHIIGTIMPWFT